MYIACRELVTVKGKRQAGDELPEVETWSESIINSHLNLKWIRKVEGSEVKTPAPKPIAAVEAVAVTTTEKVKCATCNRDFKNSRSMKIHVAQAHKVT